MDKQTRALEYTRLVTELGELPHQVVLSAGAALVMLGIREETQDLDVDVSESVFKWLALKHPIITEDNISPRIAYREHIDVHVFNENTGVVCVSGVWIYSPGEMLRQKLYLADIPNRTAGKRKKDLSEADQLRTLMRSTGLTARWA